MSTAKGEACVSWKQLQVLHALEQLGPLTMNQLRDRGVKNAASSVAALVNRYKMVSKTGDGHHALNRRGERFLRDVRTHLKVAPDAGKVEDRLKRLEGFVLNLKAAVAVGTVQ